MADKLNLPLEVRQAIAHDLVGYVDASTSAKGAAEQWWRVCENVYLAEEGADWGTGEEGDETWEVTNRPLSQPRLDALVSQVVMVIAKQNPILLDLSDDSALASAKAEMNQRIWLDAQFKMRLRAAVQIAVNTDLAFMRFAPLGRGKMEIQVIHPRDMAVFPALTSATGLDSATFVGHKIERPRRYVLSRKASGFYYNDDTEATGSTGDPDKLSNPDVRRSGATDTGGGPRPALDIPVEIWDCWVRLDLDHYKSMTDDEAYDGKGEKIYRASFDRAGVSLLHLEEYTLSTPWYVELRIIGGLPFWPVTSVGRNLIGLQAEYNILWSLHYQSVATAAGPPIIGPSPTQKFTTYEKYSFIDSDAPAGSYFSPQVRAEVASIPGLLQYLETVADSVARISKNTTGGDVSQQTATEAQIVASGVAVGLEDYIECAGNDLGRAGRLTEEIVYADYEEFAARFSMTDEDPDGGDPDGDDSATDGGPPLSPGDPSAALGVTAPPNDLTALLASLGGGTPQ